MVFDLIEHPWFQRLRHIKQLGLTDFVYPSAQHTRFQHALGALHLMVRVLDSLRSKGVMISDDEYEASLVAVLLHDIGHGPLSHALEDSLLIGVRHESMSYIFMQHLNKEFNGALHLALKIFQNTYKRKFFNQLISSQLDIDRLDYLIRDCVFTGVPEGMIGVDRIISMITVHRDQLVVEEKGIYTIENFLNARRLMYWQVYLHKTTVSSERMVVNLIRRAQHLVKAGENLPASNALTFFLKNPVELQDFKDNFSTLALYGKLDDQDLWGSIKFWMNHKDFILSTLSTMLYQRKLFQIILSSEPIRKAQVEKVKDGITDTYGVLRSETPYLFSHGLVTNEAYTEGQKINILMRSGEVLDIAQASDLPSIKAISKIVKKNYLCWPKNVSL